MATFASLLVASFVALGLAAMCRAQQALPLKPEIGVSAGSGASGGLASSIFDRMCYNHPASVPSCSLGPFVPLSSQAPEPVTLGGKLAVKVSAYMYTCWRKDRGACALDKSCYWVDAENHCTVTPLALQQIRFTMVCPNSKAEVANACAKLNKDEATCGKDPRCKWSPCNGQLCNGTSISTVGSTVTNSFFRGDACLGNVPTLLDGDVSVLPALQEGKQNVWGCCMGQELYLGTWKCSKIRTSTLCTGSCQWNDKTNECDLSLLAQSTLWGKEESKFASFLLQADAACQGQVSEDQCVKQTNKVAVDSAKVKKYMELQLKEDGNTCAEVFNLSPPGSQDFGNASAPSSSISSLLGAASSRRPALAGLGLLALGAVAAAVL